MSDERQAGLKQRLRRASANELQDLILRHGRDLRIGELRQILLNPYVTAAVIDELAMVRTLMRTYAAKAALARHPRTTQPTALRLVPQLYWRDLMEVGIDVRIRPAVRRAADKYLVLRLPALATGERVALARRASQRVLEALREDRDDRVVAAWLENPRLTEKLLLTLANDPKSSPRGLDRIACSERWGSRYDVRAALARNPMAPLRIAFEILPDLRRPELEAVEEHQALASILRHRARQLLDRPDGE